MAAKPDEHAPIRPVVWARILLLVPFVAMLFVSSYNSAEPAWSGVPFFYWYQLIWVIVGAAIIALVYRIEH